MKRLTVLIFTLFLMQHASLKLIHADEKTDIESLLGQANEAVNSKDFVKFKALLMPESHDYNLGQSDWDLTVNDDKKKKVLLHAYPDPKTNCKFLKLKKEIDRAIYYCESDFDNKNTQTIRALSFQKTNGAWKFFGRTRIASRARAGGESASKGVPTWESQGGVLAAVDTEPKFQFEYMFRKQGTN